MDAELSNKLKVLHNKRGNLKTQLTLFERVINNLDSQNLSVEDLRNLANRLKRIEPIFEQFNIIQSDLEILTCEIPDAFELEVNAREQFQDNYFALISSANLLLETDKNNTVNPHNSTFNQSLNSNDDNWGRIKLPPVKLPNFDGNYTKWRSYHDAFNSLVHANNTLSNVEKLTYLKSSLSGEPLNLISTLQTTNANYQIALQILIKRYNNKRRIINNHVQGILNMHSSTRESASFLREITNTLQSHLNCLKSLEQPVDAWDALLVPIIISKIDCNTLKEWEIKFNNDNVCVDYVPTVNELINFLINKQNVLEALAHNKHLDSLKSNFNSSPRVTKVFTTTEVKCVNCQSNHIISNCETFLKLNSFDRNAKIRELKICINCLRKGHFLYDCKSMSRCRQCKKRHHTLLHIEQSKPVSPNNINQSESNHIQQLNEDINSQVTTELAQTNSVTSCSSITNSQTLLSTAVIHILDNYGKLHKARALLDSASQSNFITQEFYDRLKLNGSDINLNVVGIGNGSINISKRVIIKFSSCYNNYSNELPCLVIPRITSSLPTQSFSLDNIKIPPNIKLSDSEFNKSKPVDILIGASIFWQLICIGQIRQNAIIFQKTQLGWIISGELMDEKFSTTTNPVTCLTLNELNDKLERFWNFDEFVSKQTILTKEEAICENHFLETLQRDKNGKFIVKYPFKNTLNNLGDSYSVAKQRLLSLEKRFRRDPKIKIEYVNFINEYILLNHMSKIELNENPSFYLPHHCIIKETSETTKLRVVFDGSCKLEKGLSINEVQYVGATMQDDIFSIISRFRLYEHVLTADIEKMYRQIWVHRDHRRFQKILWRENEHEEISTYQLNTVTYGTTAAPFLAVRCLLQVALENQKQFPRESEIIRSDFYVDDLITGSDNLYELIKTKNNIQSILNAAGFNLRKFTSNRCELREEQKSTTNLICLSNQENKTLGVCWNPNTDKFNYSINNILPQSTISKRTILALVSQLYDPLGLLAPVIVIGKLIIQELWQLGLRWDESIPMELYEKWINFKESLININNVSIPRHALITNYKSIEIHAFSDASERAYGSCIYLRSIDCNNKVLVTLLAAKSRVAPLKNVSLARLELCAAVLSAQLVNKFKSILRLNFNKEIFWSDSTIVLYWIKGNLHKWKTYVANRVAEICRLTNPNNWYHVTSKENSADLISRGVLPDKLIHNNLWWHGPQWLSNKEIELKQFNNVTSISEAESEKISCHAFEVNSVIPIKNIHH